MRLAAKRLASLTCAAALMLSLAACSTSSASSAESTDAPSMSAPGEGTLTSLTNNGTIHFNGYTITLADGTVLS